jgi:hypothetical protein
MKIGGGCLCGQVRYSADAEPAFVGVCHCKNCQKHSGSAFAIVAALPRPALAVTGSPKTYDDRGDSGQILHRHFCPDCGSSLFDEADLMPGVAMILTGTLDDSDWVKPAMEIFCDSKQPWVSLGGDQHRFPKMPPPPQK